MEPYDQLDALDLGIFSGTAGAQTFPPQHGAPHGPSASFYTPEQAPGYPPPYRHQGASRVPPQAPGAGRPVNIVLPNGNTETFA